MGEWGCDEPSIEWALREWRIGMDGTAELVSCGAVFLFVCAVLAAIAWWGLLVAPWRAWSTRERIEPAGVSKAVGDVCGVDVIVPARDEADTIARTLTPFQRGGGGIRVILVDDQSSDGTAEFARGVLPESRLTVIEAGPLPEGWSGKLWALERGFARATVSTVLLLDADIELADGMLGALLQKLEADRLDMVSVMASLRMESFCEKLLAPAFIYFFKLLYPFALSNSPRSNIAAAAGGCILIRAEALKAMGGFEAIRGALIDDCTLARRVKGSGGRIWLGLSRGVRSHRAYPSLKSIWEMVARNAFTQLRYSPWLLLLTTCVMLLVFWAPVAGLLAHSGHVRLVSAFALAGMMAAYLPTLGFYKRSSLWALALPAIGALFLMMTWSSAISYWRGARSKWKGRVYA